MITRYYTDDAVTLYHGKALDVLQGIPDGSVDCCVTSPPYFGLRDYGVEGQYGLEKTPAEYVENMRVLFAEVRRVLADDGTLWINLGDSYSSKTKGSGGTAAVSLGGGESHAYFEPRKFATDRPDKNLLGIPWRTAFALQDDGWILRNSIVWAKPNAMPESVTDRLSTKHELIFLFSKSRRYWFDLDPIRETHITAGDKQVALPNKAQAWSVGSNGNHQGNIGGVGRNEAGRNPGDVWEIPTQPFPGAHFAVFPTEIPRRCIAAGCAPRVCQECGHKPEPTKERGGMDMSRPQAKRAMEIATEHGLTEEHFDAIRSAGATDAGKAAVTQSGTGKNTARVTELALEAKRALRGYYREFLLDRLVTNGWTDCGHNAYRAGTVLDPFSGSGTTGLAAGQLGRRYVGIDLNRDYLDLSLRTRLAQAALMNDTGDGAA